MIAVGVFVLSTTPLTQNLNLTPKKLNTYLFVLQIDLERTFELSAINMDTYVKYYKRRPKAGETLDQIDAEFEAPVGIDEEVTEWVKVQRAEKMKQEAIVKVSILKYSTKLLLASNFDCKSGNGICRLPKKGGRCL